MEKKKVFVSGIRPTGKLHIGPLCGALNLIKELQDSGNYKPFVFIADVQALTDNAENPEKILLGGGGACLPNLTSYLSERLGLSVETVNPFRNVVCDSSVVGDKGMSLALSNIYAPALGLAMRKF